MMYSQICELRDNIIKKEYKVYSDGNNIVSREIIEKYKYQAEDAERRGDYGQVAELRYGKIASAQKEIEELTAQKEANPDPMINESVVPEDIAEIVKDVADEFDYYLIDYFAVHYLSPRYCQILIYR